MPSGPEAAMRRRRTFVALVALLLLLLLAFTLWSPGGSPATRAGRTSRSPARGAASPASTPSTGASAASGATRGGQGATSDPMPPAYLAWMTGGFPPTFRSRVRGLDRLARTVVVAGDTRWLTLTRDAAGKVVDRPTPPFAYPIDAFSVDPAEYAPFLPASLRANVVDALRSGKAVLGESSARLRRIGAGGSMTFDAHTVRVGAVVPDDAVGWSEMLVSRAVGSRLGIVDDRYLLAEVDGSPTAAAFGRWVSRLLPAGTPLRSLAPGGSPYMRVASGVNPPIVQKEEFGEFSAYPQPNDPAYLTEDPRWVSAHIATRTVPLLGRITCNRALFPMLVASLRAVQRAGLAGLIHTNSGCWSPRTVARSPTAPPSDHAYGAAVDINAPENPYGSPPTMDPRIVRIFEAHGFNWGGDFLIPDGMHFEDGRPP